MEDVNQLIEQRLQKLQKLNEMNVDPYPYKFDRSHASTDVKENFSELEGKEVRVAGRLMANRLMGKAAFCDILDMHGRVQIFIKKDIVGETSFEVYKLLDIGDIIGVAGEVFQTRTGEISILVKELVVLCKTLRPFPIAKEKEEDGKRVVYDSFSDKLHRDRALNRRSIWPST